MSIYILIAQRLGYIIVCILIYFLSLKRTRNRNFSITSIQNVFIKSPVEVKIEIQIQFFKYQHNWNIGCLSFKSHDGKLNLKRYLFTTINVLTITRKKG